MEHAENLLRHYLRTVWRQAGLTWDSVNDAEVGVIVDAIHDFVRAEIRAQIRAHLHHDHHGPV